MSTNAMTVAGVVLSTFIGATGLNVILPDMDEKPTVETVFIEVEQIKSSRYTNTEAARDWAQQIERDETQNASIARLERKLDDLIAAQVSR